MGRRCRQADYYGAPLQSRAPSRSYPDWSYNDLAKWRYADLPRALGCSDWVTARVETLGELDDAMKAARQSKSGAYIEIIGGRTDMPKDLAFAHTRLKELYGDTPQSN